jgi:hypothetical protein
MMPIEIKISAAGWLCVKDYRGRWLPVFKVTGEQLHEFNETLKLEPTLKPKDKARKRSRQV